MTWCMLGLTHRMSILGLPSASPEIWSAAAEAWCRFRLSWLVDAQADSIDGAHRSWSRTASPWPGTSSPFPLPSECNQDCKLAMSASVSTDQPKVLQTFSIFFYFSLTYDASKDYSDFKDCYISPCDHMPSCSRSTFRLSCGQNIHQMHGPAWASTILCSAKLYESYNLVGTVESCNWLGTQLHPTQEVPFASSAVQHPFVQQTHFVWLCRLSMQAKGHQNQKHLNTVARHNPCSQVRLESSQLLHSTVLDDLVSNNVKLNKMQLKWPWWIGQSFHLGPLASCWYLLPLFDILYLAAFAMPTGPMPVRNFTNFASRKLHAVEQLQQCPGVYYSSSNWPQNLHRYPALCAKQRIDSAFWQASSLGSLQEFRPAWS